MIITCSHHWLKSDWCLAQDYLSLRLFVCLSAISVRILSCTTNISNSYLVLLFISANMNSMCCGRCWNCFLFPMDWSFLKPITWPFLIFFSKCTNNIYAYIIDNISLMALYSQTFLAILCCNCLLAGLNSLEFAKWAHLWWVDFTC